MVKSWDIDESDFPKSGSLRDKIRFCLRYAILAHSTYNNQPWYFVIDEDTVGVYADRRYALPVLDPDDRQLTIACGSALYNLRVAARYFGFEENTQLLPNPADENLMARVQFKDAGKMPSEKDIEMFRALPVRHINRSAFDKTDVPEEHLDALKSVAREENTWLHICEGDERDIVAHFVAEGDQIQMSNKAFRRELAAWANERRFLSRDGYPDYARSLKDMMSSSSPKILRRFETAPGQVVQDDAIAKGCPVIAILGSEKGSKADRLQTGEALSAILLKAQALGLAVSTMNQPCEVPELRLRLHDEISDEFSRAHVILRIGYADRVVNLSPRRDIDSFIDSDDDMAFMQQRASNDDRKSGGGGLLGFFGRLFGTK
ncbi:MAG: nitroreductase [Pseudomonadota bacterium]